MSDKKTWSPNDNHPVKGRSTLVDAIYDLDDVYRIIDLLSDKPRDTCLFLLGINTGYRAVDLCRLTVGDVAHLRAWDILEIKEKKTGKYRSVLIGNVTVGAIHRWLVVHPDPRPETPLFYSFKTKQALLPRVVTAMVKDWCKEIGLSGNYGSRTLRRTYARHQVCTFGTSLPLIQDDLGHASQKDTLRYISLMPHERQAMFRNQLGGNKYRLYLKTFIRKIIH